jgi:hypothetical protein
MAIGILGRAVALAAASGGVALGLFAHAHRACTVLDTPYIPVCPTTAHAPAAKADQVRDRLARNPGDAEGWLQFLEVSGPEADAVLRANAAVAPNDPNVLRWTAARALEQGRLDEGVASLVRFLEYRWGDKEARILAALIARGDGTALLQRHVGSENKWLAPVLAAMGALKVPAAQALPLVSAALEKGGLPDGLKKQYMDSLKASGNWVDAYGLWMTEHKEAPLLFNGGFDQAIATAGFDWEVSPAPRSRTGNHVQQVPAAQRGHVLQVEFTGRPFSVPVVWQYVFTPPGAYRLRGEYSASRLKSEGGLVWKVECVNGDRKEIGRSPALLDTADLWKSFELSFAASPECGPVVRIQLATLAGYEALSGIKGRIAFDNLKLDAAAPR